MIAQHLYSFFWDVDLDAFDPRSFPRYTIARLLEYGDRESIIWLKGEFSEAVIEEVIRTERTLSQKSAGFWGLIYHIPSEEIAALKH